MKNLDEIINECVEIETSEGLHVDTIEDYESPIDYYLSNMIGIKRKEYMEHLIEYYILSQKEAEYVYNDVIRIIKENYLIIIKKLKPKLL